MPSIRPKLHGLALFIALLGTPMAFHASSKPEPTPSQTPASTQAQTPKLSFGIGYPDLRLRANIWKGLDGEFKFAFDQKTQAYSIRVYGTCLKWRMFDFNVGGEAGYIQFAGLENLNGDGMFYEPFVGMRCHLSQRLSLSAEIGPAFTNLAASGLRVDNTSTIVTTAIYFHLF